MKHCLNILSCGSAQFALKLFQHLTTCLITGGFLEFLIGGMTYPDENVKSTVVYILVQVCSKTSPNSLPLPLVQNLCKHISTNLATSKSHKLTYHQSTWLATYVCSLVFMRMCRFCLLVFMHVCRFCSASVEEWCIHSVFTTG